MIGLFATNPVVDPTVINRDAWSVPVASVDAMFVATLIVVPAVTIFAIKYGTRVLRPPNVVPANFIGVNGVKLVVELTVILPFANV
jgi:hypothetical protein